MGYFFQTEARMARLFLDAFCVIWAIFGTLAIYGMADDFAKFPLIWSAIIVLVVGVPLLPTRCAVQRLIEVPERKWQAVTPTVARRQPLYGHDGWGLLPIVIIGFMTVYYASLPLRVSPGQIWACSVLAVIVLAIAALSVRAFLARRPYFPVLSLALIGLSLLVNMAEAAYWSGALGGLTIAPFVSSSLVAALGNLMGAFALMSYLDRSRRINVTFRNLVPR